MLHILILFSFMKISYEQEENTISYILPKENQFITGAISNLQEKILKTSILGFGLWFKWQPFALQDIQSNTDTDCQNQFIFSLENQEKKQSIYILYLHKNDPEYKLNIFSDIFIFTEEIQLINQFEGVWMFLNSFFDFHKKEITFYLYKSVTQELSQYKFEDIVILQNQIQYQIGNVCDQCSALIFGSCFSSFEGRLSILFEQDNFDESSYLNYLEAKYILINDCKASNREIILGNKIYDGDFYSVINLGILEKFYFQLSGWVKVIYDDSYLVYYDVFKIVSNYKENLSDFELKLFIYYILSKEQSNNGINVKANPNFQLSKNKTPVTNVDQNIQPSVLREWHFIQIDVGYPDQAGTLKFYSNLLEDVKTLAFDLTSYTGFQFGLYIGGDKYSEIYLKGNIANLVFKTFCQPIEQEFTIMCHYTCQTCFGPFYDNCLSCESSNKRILKNDQCACDTDAFQFQEFKACQTINSLFQNLITIEEELPCKQEGYDRCDDIIVCSFGYFKYQETYCIQCPQYSSMDSDSNILCINCIIDPNQFSTTLTCTHDAIKLNQGGQSTYDRDYRNDENIECFEIIKLKNQYQLQLIENKTYNKPDVCRRGYYYKNEKCQQCGYGCLKCENLIKCSQCEEGYYLDKNNVCAKCQDCLKCELKKEQFNCLQCPQKYYLKNQQCLSCGLYCADCRLNGYCNYCIDSQKYFISIDGINCIICNIQHCKYCYQINRVEDQILAVSYNLDLEKNSNKKQSIDKTIYCAKCQEGYIVDLITNTCIERHEIIVSCQYGNYDEISNVFSCQSWIDVSNDSQCNSLRNCKFCVQDKCIECQIGFYIDFLAKGCQKCPTQCQNCIYQNKRLMDNWKYEILAIEQQWNPGMSKYEHTLSDIKNDYQIQCTSCPLNYILYDSDCIAGCNEECLKCEIIKGKATCVECKSIDSQAVRSINSQGQCMRCQNNCELCIDGSVVPEETNKFFIENQENSIYTRSCYKSLPSMGSKKNFVNQFTVIDCEKYNKCNRKSQFTWNIYCDIKQFEKMQNKKGFFQEGNYYFNEFFEKDIFSSTQIPNLFMFFNEQVTEYIDIIINIFQGNVNSCKPSQPLEDILRIQSSFLQNIFFLKGVNLKVIGQQSNILLENFIFDISGFQEIKFENLNFRSNQIKIQDTFMNSIYFIDCSFENDSPIQTLTTYNLNLVNTTIKITNITQESIFQFHFRDDDNQYQDIKIIIDGLRIIDSKFLNNKLISIITDIGPKVTCQINNLEIFETEFENSFLLATSTSSGLKNMYIGDLFASKLKIKNVNLKNSILFYTPNILQFNINTLTIQNLTLVQNSYLVQSNQFNFYNFQLEEIKIDKSYLFSNKVTLLYQTSFGDNVNIFFNQITIKNTIYNQEQSLLQFIRYINCKVIVNINYFRITEVSQLFSKQNLISQEKSLIHISCSECYLNQIYITRKNGIPELSLIDTELIVISNSFFTKNEKQAQALIEDCQPKVQNQFPYFIYIGQYQKIRIDNLTIIDAISYNYPFIILKGIVLQNQFDENIEIINSKFFKNLMITSESNSPTSIIQIYTEQKCFINLTNLQFQDNHLNVEYQDLITHSSSTLLIDTLQGKIFMKDCLFQQNIITNSTDSPLYSKAQKIEIENSRFIQNNILNLQSLINRIQSNSFGVSVSNYDLQQVIQVFSNGGSGYFLTNNLTLKNCQVEESYSLYGGAFYVNTFGNAYIQIEDSTFAKTSSSLQSSASSNGGCFYIDAQISKLTLLVKNSTFNQCYSRSKGGCFYILPSNSYNFVYFEQIKVMNSFSTTGQFFDYSPQNLNNIISNVTFYKIQLVYDKIAFDQFLGLLDSLSSDEALMIVNNGPIMLIKYGNVTINSIYCQFEIKIYLSQIEQGSNINLNEIYVDKGFIWNSPFLSLNLKSDLQGMLKMSNIKIQNLLEYQEMKYEKDCEEMLAKNIFKQFCISPVFMNKQISFENNMEKIQQITFCKNKNLIFKTEKKQFSLIMISNINTFHKIIINKILLSWIICKNCNDGILSLTNINQIEENNIILNGISIYNSFCGIKGCLSIINKNSNNFLKTNFLKKESRMLQENFEILKFTVNFQVSLTNSRFISNTADYGGAVCVIDLDIVIDQCYFQKNKAKVGGAIYSFISQSQNFRTIIFASLFVENSAELAADLYQENQMLQQTNKLQVIMENNSTTQESNVFESPRSLAITTNQDSIILQKKVVQSTQTQVVEKIIIEPYTILGSKDKVDTLMFPSGQTIGEYQYFDISTSTNIPYNLSLKIIALNMLNQKEDQLNGSICTLEHKVINLTSSAEIDDFYAKLSISQIVFNTSTLDFNLNNLIVSFNPYYDKEIVFRLFIKCNMIKIPVYDKNPPYLITNIITDYILLADIKTFPCQLGEYFNSTSKICIKCNSDQSQYQVELNANICSIKDETKIKSVESGKIELIPNFWRAYFYSTKIEECYHLLENCLGGWQPGDKSCSFGHIGALCEQCDLYNIRGDGHFSTSSPYKCSSCEKIEGNIITISLISLWTLISVLMSVNSTIDTINLFIAGSKLIQFGVSSLLKQSSTAVLIKVFTNYLQIIQTISTFQLKVPAGLSQSLTSVGNPIEQVAYSLDCFLMSISDISIIYFRIIWSLLMAISYVSTFFLFLGIAILLKQIKFNISMISTALIYIFIFLQPNLIQSLISLVSFRILSNIAWVQGNVAYHYATASHKYWMITFCLPILLSFSLLIPLIMFYCVRSNKHHLEQIKTRETWGYLYNEYKLKAYFWEFIKIFQKELIIIFLAYYEDFIAIKASLVFLVIFAYSIISTFVQPYMTGELNKFDSQSTTVCAVSIILGSSIYTAQNQNFIEIVYPFYIIIALINGWFLFKIIINIFLAYFDKLHEQIDKVKDIISQKFPNQVLKYPQVQKLLESKKTKLQKIQSRFQMIKQYLIPKAKKIIKLKQQTEFDKDCDVVIQKVDQKIQTNYTSINKYPKPQNLQLEPKFYTDSDSQISLDEQED